MVNSVSSTGMNYAQWEQALHSRGIKTTSLGNGEANFADYTGALSESLKQEIKASFDTPEDLELQATLASLYGGRSVLSSAEIQKLAKQNGIQVSIQYVSTTYIVDNKKDGHYDTDVTNGSIAVYTFTDGKGGSIKIADANGNGSLETEELFMNEILSGVTSDLKASSSAKTTGQASNAQANTTTVNMQDQIADLQAQYQEQLEAQQRLIDEQMAELEKFDKRNEARKIIASEYSNAKIDDIRVLAEVAANKSYDYGISVRQVLVEILGEPKKEDSGKTKQN